MNKLEVGYMITNGQVTLIYDGKTRMVAAGDARFQTVIDAINAGEFDSIPDIVEPELALKKKGLDVVDGLVMVKGEAMPPELNQRVMEYHAKNLPYKSLLAFWENLKQNPSFNSRQQLFKFLENKGHAITEDGCFIGYRGIRDDFKDKHTGTMDNSIGSVCEMPRDQVDDNPNNTCSHGLHVGGYEYAKDFGANGKLVIVKVNPKDVVAVPNDYNGQKMRVCRFVVLKETTEFLQETVVGADGSDCFDTDPWPDVQWSDDSEDNELDLYSDENPEVVESPSVEVSGSHKVSQEQAEDMPKDDTPSVSGTLKMLSNLLKAFEIIAPSNLQMSQKDTSQNDASQDVTKSRYSNNHNVRGPNGKFVKKNK